MDKPAFLLAFGISLLLFSGCLGYFEFEQAGEPQLVGESAPVEEIPAPVILPEGEVQEEPAGTPEEVAEPEAQEVEEEKLVQWDVGVEEEVDEGHRKLQAVEFDGYLLIVDDITDDRPYPCAAVRVGKQGSTYIETLFQDKVCPGESTYWESPEGGKYRIKVFETAAGYAGYAYWANVAVYKQGE